jgi:hypothetical protein
MSETSESKSSASFFVMSRLYDTEVPTETGQAQKKELVSAAPASCSNIRYKRGNFDMILLVSKRRA